MQREICLDTVICPLSSNAVGVAEVHFSHCVLSCCSCKANLQQQYINKANFKACSTEGDKPMMKHHSETRHVVHYL